MAVQSEQGVDDSGRGGHLAKVFEDCQLVVQGLQEDWHLDGEYLQEVEEQDCLHWELEQELRGQMDLDVIITETFNVS